MPTIRNGRPVLAPNLGVYLGVPPLLIPERGLQDCRNVRIFQRKIVRDNLGWSPWPNSAGQFNLDAKPVLFIGTFTLRSGLTRTLFGNTTDLFVVDLSTNALRYITPRVAVGTASWTAGTLSVTGQGTDWLTSVKAGDFFSPGNSAENNPTGVWHKIASVQSNILIILETTPVTSGAVQPYTIRSTFTGDSRKPFSAASFFLADKVGPGTPTNMGDRLYLTNGVNKIVAWDGVADQVYRPDLGNVDSARSVVRYRNILVFLAPTLGGVFSPNTIRSSAIGQPENTVTLEASEITATDGIGDLLAAHPLGELLALYSERGITLAQFVGPPLIFVFRTAVTGFGPLSTRAIAIFSDRHLFIGPDAHYVFDGVNAQPIDDHVWRDVIRRHTPARIDFIHNIKDESRGELIWSIPLTSDADITNGVANTAFSLHYLENTGERTPNAYTIRDFSSLSAGIAINVGNELSWNQVTNTWATFTGRWNDSSAKPESPQILFGAMDGKIWSLNTNAGANGVAFKSFVKFSRRALTKDPARKSTLRRVYPLVTEQQGATHSLTTTVKMINTADAQAVTVITKEYGLSDTQKPKFVPVRKSAVYMEIEFGTTLTLQPWELLGYDIDITRAGERT